MTEQEATDKLEELVGNVDRCFQLMRLYGNCKATVSNTIRKAVTVEDLFRKSALAKSYSTEAIEHYLNHVR